MMENTTISVQFENIEMKWNFQTISIATLSFSLPLSFDAQLKLIDAAQDWLNEIYFLHPDHVPHRMETKHGFSYNVEITRVPLGARVWVRVCNCNIAYRFWQRRSADSVQSSVVSARFNSTASCNFEIRPECGLGSFHLLTMMPLTDAIFKNY